MFDKIKIFNDYKHLVGGSRLKKRIVAIGNFDGLHLGHRYLLDKMVTYARDQGLSPAVLTFHPNPAEWFKAKHFAGYIFNTNQKMRALGESHIELVLNQNFDHAFSNLSPIEFMNEVLIKALNAHVVVVGDDFRFGKNRSGSASDLAHFFSELGRKVVSVELLTNGGQTASSTLIRKSLECGDLGAVSKALGHSFVLEGEVVHGRKLARSLGFPTANLSLGNYVKPKFGVYGGRVVIHESERDLGLIHPKSNAHLAAINIGVKPTISEIPMPMVEVHLINLDMDFDYLYGKRISVFPEVYIREERKFSSLEELTKQIGQDVNQIKSLLLGP